MRLLAAMILLAAGQAFAGGVGHSDIPQISNVSTGTTVGITTNTSNRILRDKLIHSIIIDISGVSSGTVDVDVATDGTAGSARTLFTTNSITSDIQIYPRQSLSQPSGKGLAGDAMIPVIADKVNFWGSNANKTGVNVRAWIITIDE